jgi:hypothetical protein
MLKTQDKKIELETTRVAVKKRKGDFMNLTANTSNMDDEVKTVYMFYCDATLQEMRIQKLRNIDDWRPREEGGGNIDEGRPGRNGKTYGRSGGGRRAAYLDLMSCYFCLVILAVHASSSIIKYSCRRHSRVQCTPS